MKYRCIQTIYGYFFDLDDSFRVIVDKGDIWESLTPISSGNGLTHQSDSGGMKFHTPKNSPMIFLKQNGRNIGFNSLEELLIYFEPVEE